MIRIGDFWVRDSDIEFIRIEHYKDVIGKPHNTVVMKLRNGDKNYVMRDTGEYREAEKFVADIIKDINNDSH